MRQELIDQIRQAVSRSVSEKIDDIFQEAVEFPQFVMEVACLAVEGAWELSGWSLSSVKWRSRSVEVKILLRAACAGVTLIVPTTCVVDEGLDTVTVMPDGIVEQTDEEWEVLRAGVRMMGYPQAVTVRKAFDKFTVGDVLLLDAVNEVYVLTAGGVMQQERQVGAGFVARQPHRFEPITDWPG